MANNTIESQKDHRLPYSGFLIGELGTALRLKHSLTKHTRLAGRSKTIQRYHAGQPISSDAREKILESLVVCTLFPNAQLETLNRSQVHLKAGILQQLKAYTEQWDFLAGWFNSAGLAMKEPVHVALPIMRLFFLDAGFRLGAWRIVTQLDEKSVFQFDIQLDGKGLSTFLRTRFAARGVSVESVAEKLDVSTQTVSKWRNAKAWPNDNHIKHLGRFLGDTELPAERVEIAIRLHVAIDVLHGRLLKLAGKRRASDLIEAMTQVASWVEEAGLESLLPEGPNAGSQDKLDANPRLLELLQRKAAKRFKRMVTYGAASPLGRYYAEQLAQHVSSIETTADLTMLPHTWLSRILHGYWIISGRRAMIDEVLRRRSGTSTISDEDVIDWVDNNLEDHFDFGSLLGNSQAQVSVQQTPLHPSYLAQVAWSRADFNAAQQHLQDAINVSPTESQNYLSLAVLRWATETSCGNFEQIMNTISEKMNSSSDSPESLLMEAHALRLSQMGPEKSVSLETVTILKKAVELDQTSGVPAFALARICMDSARHHDAKNIFLEIEDRLSESSFYWLWRGDNALALNDLEDAKHAFEQAKKCAVDGENPMAKTLRYATLMAMGRKMDARKDRSGVRHAFGVDPIHFWRAFLNSDDGKVGQG